jgi:hypothetical protein
MSARHPHGGATRRRESGEGGLQDRDAGARGGGGRAENVLNVGQELFAVAGGNLVGAGQDVLAGIPGGGDRLAGGAEFIEDGVQGAALAGKEGALFSDVLQVVEVEGPTHVAIPAGGWSRKVREAKAAW